MSIKTEAECDVCGKREPAKTTNANYPSTWINVKDARPRDGQDAWLCSWGCVLRYGIERQNEADE